jgi:hypothetical protein
VSPVARQFFEARFLALGGRPSEVEAAVYLADWDDAHLENDCRNDELLSDRLDAEYDDEVDRQIGAWKEAQS